MTRSVGRSTRTMDSTCARAAPAAASAGGGGQGVGEKRNTSDGAAQLPADGICSWCSGAGSPGTFWTPSGRCSASWPRRCIRAAWWAGPEPSATVSPAFCTWPAGSETIPTGARARAYVLQWPVREGAASGREGKKNRASTRRPARPVPSATAPGILPTDPTVFSPSPRARARVYVVLRVVLLYTAHTRAARVTGHV